MKNTPRPDWNDAPEWARWLAMDYNGNWYWYKNEPKTTACFLFWDAPGDTQGAKIRGWRLSLEQRPSAFKRKWNKMKHKLYAFYQNHIMATLLGRLPGARGLDSALYWLFFSVAPGVVVGAIVAYLIWRYK